MLTARLLARLQTPQGGLALAAARRALEEDSDFLRASQAVARTTPDDLARAAVEQEILRLRARHKFSRAADLFFTQEGLEQATAEPVAEHRAERFANGPHVFDLGCGQGGDSLALARKAPVVAIDRDGLRLAILKANASNLGRERDLAWVQADLRSLPLRFPPGALGFSDPGRRRDGRRLRGVESYQPPLSVALGWLSDLAGLAVKVSPAVRLSELEGLACEVEFVSLRRELKEATLWFGVLRRGVRRATLLPERVTLEASADVPAEIVPLGSYLLEPDPAVLRAGLVYRLGAELGARPIAEAIAFLTTDVLPDSPFVRAFRVLEAGPFRLKDLRSTLRRRGVGRLTIKRRGSAVEPEALLPRLRLEGDSEALVVLTRLAGRQAMILAEPVSGGGGSRLLPAG